jgi:hypothetical protein
MTSSRDDVLALLDFAFERLRDRLQGLTDEEWMWQPTADDRITLRWRLEHVAAFPGGLHPRVARSRYSAVVRRPQWCVGG